MTVKTGYKLQCEFCGCLSEEYWDIPNPEEYILDNKNAKSGYYDFPFSYPFYNNSRKYILEDDWQSDQTGKWIDDYTEEPNKFFKGVFKKVKTKTYETRNIYFCSKEHRDIYLRLKQALRDECT